MREPVDASKILSLLQGIGRAASGPGKIYLTGGASALLEGWRASTVDVDIKLDPEPPGVFEAIARLKKELRLNIELASPDQFLPTLPSWRTNSRFIARYGKVDFFHYDFRAQALSKLIRARDRDLRDVQAMIERNLITVEELQGALEDIRPGLVRFPNLEVEILDERVRRLVTGRDD